MTDQPESTSAPSLERSIGLGRVMFQSATTMAPGASVVFGLGLIMVYSGVAAPFSMLLGTVAAILIAFCIAQFATRIPGAGGFYSYAAATFGSSVGFIVGLLFSSLYVIIVCLSTINFSLNAQSFFEYYWHLSPPLWLLAAILVVVLLVATYVGVRTSTGLAAVLGAVELVIILLLSILLIARAGDSNSFSYFNPANAASPGTSTLHNVFLGAVFAFAAMSGFEAAAPLAEETKNPRRTVPLALVLSAAVIGLCYVLATYAAIVGWGPGHLSGYISADNAWREMGGKISSALAVLVSLAIINSTIAGSQAGYNSVSRLLFAMGRSGTLPTGLARIDRRYRTPGAAVLAGGVLTAVLIAIGMAIFGAYGAFVFYLTLSSFIFLLLYAVMVIGATVYVVSRHRGEFNVLYHVVVPVLALCLLLPTIYYSLQGLTYPANRALPVLGAMFVVAIVVLAWLKARGTDISAERQHWLREEDVVLDGAEITAAPAAE